MCVNVAGKHRKTQMVYRLMNVSEYYECFLNAHADEKHVCFYIPTRVKNIHLRSHIHVITTQLRAEVLEKCR